MGAVDGPTKMDVSLDDIIKQVRAAVGPRSLRLPRDNFASARTLTFESSHPEHAPRARRRPGRRRKPPPRKRRRRRCVFERAIRPRRPGDSFRVRIDRANAHLPNRIRARRDSRVPASDARPSRPDPTRPVPSPQAKKATPKKAPKKSTPAKSPKKKAAKVKATATKSSDKRGAVLAKKRGLSTAAVRAAEDKARKAALGRAKPKKAAPVKGKRVGKKVTVAIRVTKKQGPKSKGPAAAAAKTPQPAAGTLRITIRGAGASTPPKPKPGSQRAGARGKLKSGAPARKAANAQRQSVGRGGKMAGARGMDLGVSRRVQKPAAKRGAAAAKTKAGRGSTGQLFPVGMSVTGKVKVTAPTGKGDKAKGGRGGRR